MKGKEDISEEEKNLRLERGQRLVWLRTKLGYNQAKDFAMALGNSLYSAKGKTYDPASLSNIEKGKMAIPHKVQMALMSDFDVDLNWLLWGKGGPLLDGDPIDKSFLCLKRIINC